MTTTVPLWDSLSPDEHEFQYNPQRAVPDFAQSRLVREPTNRLAHETLRKHGDVAYGDHPRRKLDIFCPDLARGVRTPVHIFFHGGYWRAQDKEAFAFIATPLVAAGVTAVVANYELCPAATLDEVVDSALAVVEWVHRNIAQHQGDPARISVSGHSAGAHLCAEVLACDWTAATWIRASCAAP
jgi:arylformamidase